MPGTSASPVMNGRRRIVAYACGHCGSVHSLKENAFQRGPAEAWRRALECCRRPTTCRTCGTPLPAEEDEQHVYLTAGTLDEPLGVGVKGHLFYGSRADWSADAPHARYFVERSAGPTCAPDPVAAPPT